jgi:hypothetical protein
MGKSTYQELGIDEATYNRLKSLDFTPNIIMNEEINKTSIAKLLGKEELATKFTYGRPTSPTTIDVRIGRDTLTLDPTKEDDMVTKISDKIATLNPNGLPEAQVQTIINGMTNLDTTKRSSILPKVITNLRSRNPP